MVRYSLVRVFAPASETGELTLFGLQDGVDVDYEDFDAFDSGKAEAWIIAYTRQLRARLPSPYIRTFEFSSLAAGLR